MSMQVPRIYLPPVEFTTLYTRKGDVFDIREANIVCIYDPFTGVAACTGVPPGGVVLVAGDPIDMASALLRIGQKLRSEGIPAKDVHIIETMTYADIEDKKFIKQELNLLKNLIKGAESGMTVAPLF